MRRFATISVLLALLGGAVLILGRPTDDGLGRFPHTYLKTAGYDPALIEVQEGPLGVPPPPGEGLQAAWVCDDPAFADREGRPWLFPLNPAGGSEPVPPVHPVLKRRPALSTCHFYFTPEGAALIRTFAATVVK